MRQLRLLILLLVLASALLVALVRPLPGHAAERRDGQEAHAEALAQAATTGAGTTTSRSRKRTLGVRVVKYARRFVGVPYVWGGSSPRYGFDCSGFVRYVYQHFGISLPHSSYGDMSRGRSVLRKYLKPGDLVFFDGGSHVGIYIGRHRVIDAPHSGAVVHISTMTDWYSSAYSGARRLDAA